MTFTNPWFSLALVAMVVLYKVELIGILLNLSRLSATVPERLRGIVDEASHERSLEYARVSAKASVVQDSVELAVFVGFWLMGGFALVDAWARSWGLGPIPTGLGIIGVLALAQTLLSLPFSWYDTFVVEAQFGFNKMTPKTFIMDRVKGMFLGILLGGPLLATLLWLFANVPMAALYGWLLLTVVSVVMSFLAPRLIMPMFFKFQPLKDEELKADIIALGQRLGFPVADVSVVDGSRRSTKANAFFTGFGKMKRIALFDTLLNNHPKDEVLAVLAHEIGHSRRGHTVRQMIASILASGLMFLLLHFALRDPRLCAAFGVMNPTPAWGLVFFGIMYQPLSFLIGLGVNKLSRKFEFEADAYAREAVGGPEPLAQALTRLSRDHLSNLTPHPFYVWLHYSHPPMLERLAALEGAKAH